MARELAHLAQSDFRARFRLNAKDRETAQTKGDALLRQHVLEIITEFPAGSPGLEPREECGLSKFFNLGANAAKPCT